MATDYSITAYFGRNLAELLSDKILLNYAEFNRNEFCVMIESEVEGKAYTQRIEIIARRLEEYLPDSYEQSLEIILSILGPENPNETGMFKHFYWIMPLGKFIELFGLNNFDASMQAIEEITKRNTGEYAIRPYIRMYPNDCLKIIREWAVSDNFHLRRLASEGLRPKLPWSPKLDTFIHNPNPVFDILELLKEDPVMFVKKSVANHLTDWLKVNPDPTIALLKKWNSSDNIHTKWIIKRATRKIKIEL